MHPLHNSLETTLDLRSLENADFSDGEHDSSFLVVKTA